MEAHECLARKLRAAVGDEAVSNPTSRSSSASHTPESTSNSGTPTTGAQTPTSCETPSTGGMDRLNSLTNSVEGAHDGPRSHGRSLTASTHASSTHCVTDDVTDDGTNDATNDVTNDGVQSDDEGTSPPVLQSPSLEELERDLALTDSRESIVTKMRALFYCRSKDSPAAVAVLAGALGHTSSVLLRHEIAYVLGQMKQETALPILIDLLNDRDEHVMTRHEAGEAIAALNAPTEEALAALMANADDDDLSVRETVELALIALRKASAKAKAKAEAEAKAKAKAEAEAEAKALANTSDDGPPTTPRGDVTKGSGQEEINETAKKRPEPKFYLFTNQKYINADQPSQPDQPVGPAEPAKSTDAQRVSPASQTAFCTRDPAQGTRNLSLETARAILLLPHRTSPHILDMSTACTPTDSRFPSQAPSRSDSRSAFEMEAGAEKGEEDKEDEGREEEDREEEDREVTSPARVRGRAVFTHPSLHDRFVAMFTLRNLNTPEAVQALADALLADKQSALLRHELCFILGQLQAADSVDALVAKLDQRGEHAMVRHEAALALGSVGADIWSEKGKAANLKAVRALKDFAVSDPDPIIYESCLVALSNIQWETE